MSCSSCTPDKYINQNDLILGMRSSVLYNRVKYAILFSSRQGETVFVSQEFQISLVIKWWRKEQEGETKVRALISKVTHFPSAEVMLHSASISRLCRKLMLSSAVSAFLACPVFLRMGKTDVWQGWTLYLLGPHWFTHSWFVFKAVFEGCLHKQGFCRIPITLFVAHFFSEKWHSINSFLLLLMML